MAFAFNQMVRCFIGHSRHKVGRPDIDGDSLGLGLPLFGRVPSCGYANEHVLFRLGKMDRPDDTGSVHGDVCLL